MKKIIQKTISLFFLFTTISVYAALDLELTQGIDQAIPIAIVPFAQNEISTVINNDLKNCGRFNTYATNNADYDYWRQQKVENVVTGNVISVGGDTYTVSFKLYDTYNKSTLLDKSYTVSKNEFRALSHHISDLIYQQLIGIRGVFSTKIAYVVVQHPAKRQSKYTLYVADADGYNPQQLLSSSEPIMSPSWSANGKQIAYVSFENKRAAIYIQNIATGKRTVLTQYPGINGAPAWSPDGNSMALVLTLSGYPKIYVINLATKKLTQLTSGWSLDTEPSWSPDGKSLIFTSNSGGSPQIYQIALNGGQKKRVTYNSNYNARASFAPDGKSIVMLNRADGGFNIASQDLVSGRVNILADSGINKSPSIAPNGSMIVYATVKGDRGVLGEVSIDGKVKLRLPAQEGDVQDPAWSPFLD